MFLYSKISFKFELSNKLKLKNMKTVKFTFKTDKPTGKYRSFFSASHYIKLKRVVIGTIDDELPFKIRLKVVKSDINEDGNPNCSWKWITLLKRSESLEEAKEFLNKVADKIVETYNLAK